MNATYTHHMSSARQHEARALEHCMRAIAANHAGCDNATRDAAQRAARAFEDAIEQTFAAVRGMTARQRNTMRDTVDGARFRIYRNHYNVSQFANGCTSYPVSLPI